MRYSVLYTDMISKNETAVAKRIDGYLDYAVMLQAGLTAIPAMGPLNGGVGEYDKALWLESELRKLKFDEISRVDAPQKEARHGVRPNIIAKCYGENTAKTLWIMTHIDVVPPGEVNLWKTDPFKLHRDGNKIYGRGVEDDQQGLVASILAARAIIESGTRPPVNIGLLFNSDEENGSAYGAEYLLKNRPDMFSKGDLFLVPDGGVSDGKLVQISEKGILWLKVTTKGKQCHASMPALGVNSLSAASELIVRLRGLYKKFNAKDKLFFPKTSTFEPTKKEANVPNINTLPGEDVFYLDCRILPNYRLPELKAEINRIAAIVEKKHHVTISFEPVMEAECAPSTDPESEIVHLIIDAVRKVYKVKGVPHGTGGGSVAAFFRRAGFPTVVYGKIDDTAHMPNEYCILDNLIGDAKVFTLAILNAKA